MVTGQRSVRGDGETINAPEEKVSSLYSRRFWSLLSRKLSHRKSRISLPIHMLASPNFVRIACTHALINLEPSTPTRVLFPTISEGKTKSSKIFSWTAVKVLDRGRFWVDLVPFLGLGRTRRWATKTTYRSESFFSSSRVSLWVVCTAERTSRRMDEVES